MPLNEDYLRQLRDNNDIIDLAGRYVELKRSGSGYVCRCPFHSEKTPSCHFDSQKQLFHCFGCGAGGDVITFVRNIENLDFMDAVRFLAQRAGMPLPEDGSDESSEKRRRLYEMNREAGKFFHRLLFSEQGRPGLDYLRRRGLTDHTIKRFGLGYAPDDYHALHYHMKNMGYSDFELADGALLARRDNKIFDKFRNRVMFPIFDTRGNVIAFGGRTLLEDKKVPKYLNSDETAVFKKRDTLFALNYAKKSNADYFLLCEGYMDVISMHQAGFDSAVASLGTAITPNQANLLSRLGKKEIILSYDSDEAGQKAASRGINLFSEAGISVKILRMTGAKDPDEYIKKFGGDSFRRLIEDSGSAREFEMDKIASGFDLNTDEGKLGFLRRAVDFLAGITNDIEREVYISRTAKMTEIPVQSVKDAVENSMSRNFRKGKKQERREEIYGVKKDAVNPEASKYPKVEKAERGIIRVLYHCPEQFETLHRKLPRGLVTQFNGRVLDFLEKISQNAAMPDISRFNEEFETSEMGRITEIINDDKYGIDSAALNDYIKVINDYYDKIEFMDSVDKDDEALLRASEILREKKK